MRSKEWSLNACLLIGLSILTMFQQPNTIHCRNLWAKLEWECLINYGKNKHKYKDNTKFNRIATEKAEKHLCICDRKCVCVRMLFVLLGVLFDSTSCCFIELHLVVIQRLNCYPCFSVSLSLFIHRLWWNIDKNAHSHRCAGVRSVRNSVGFALLISHGRWIIHDDALSVSSIANMWNETKSKWKHE